MRWLSRFVSSKTAAALAAFGVVVVGVDVVAMVRWPVVDMGGVVAKMIFLGLVLVELVPVAGFTAFAFWLRGKPPGTATFAFWAWTLVAVPIMLLGAYVGVGSIR